MTPSGPEPPMPAISQELRLSLRRAMRDYTPQRHLADELVFSSEMESHRVDVPAGDLPLPQPVSRCSQACDGE